MSKKEVKNQNDAVETKNDTAEALKTEEVGESLEEKIEKAQLKSLSTESVSKDTPAKGSALKTFASNFGTALLFVAIAVLVLLGSSMLFSKKAQPAAGWLDVSQEEIKNAAWDKYYADEIHTKRYIAATQEATDYFVYAVDWPKDPAAYSFEDYDAENPDGTIVGTVRVGIPGQMDMKDIYVIFDTDGVTVNRHTVAVDTRIYEDDGKFEEKQKKENPEGETSGETTDGEATDFDMSQLTDLLNGAMQSEPSEAADSEKETKKAQ